MAPPARQRRIAATPRKRKKREVMKVIIKALRIKDRTFGLGFGGGDWKLRS